MSGMTLAKDVQAVTESKVRDMDPLLLGRR